MTMTSLARDVSPCPGGTDVRTARSSRRHPPGASVARCRDRRGRPRPEVSVRGAVLARPARSQLPPGSCGGWPRASRRRPQGSSSTWPAPPPSWAWATSPACSRRSCDRSSAAAASVRPSSSMTRCACAASSRRSPGPRSSASRSTFETLTRSGSAGLSRDRRSPWSTSAGEPVTWPCRSSSSGRTARPPSASSTGGASTRPWPTTPRLGRWPATGRPTPASTETSA